MAKQAKKDNKNTIIGGICAALVVVVVIVVAVVLATRGGGLNDDYFKSDDTKYVLTIDSDMTGSDSENSAVNPVKTHIVYMYSGDTITGMKTYGEFADNDAAKKAFDAIKEAGESMDGYELNGKYIIVTATEDQYKDMTASDVKAQIEFMESLKNMDLTNTETESNTNTDETKTEETEQE